MPESSIQNDVIYFIGTGAQTSVGRCFQSSAAAVRCGISAYREHPYMYDQYGEPIVVARADWLDEELSLPERITQLASNAASESFSQIQNISSLQSSIKIHLALSSENLSTLEERQHVIDHFISSLPISIRLEQLELVFEGHAGGFLALERAVKQLKKGDASICFVGGADSWLSPERLEALDVGSRLHSVDQSWGFTPAEGACFSAIATGETVKNLNLKPYAELISVATAEESKLLGTETICIGKGLTSTFHKVLNSADIVEHCYCDFNGETYRAEEYGFSICRTREFFKDPGNFTAAAECWGDVGAASALLSLSLPLAAWSRGYAQGEVNLVWSSSANQPLRAAALLRQITVN